MDTTIHEPAFPRSYTADGHNGMTIRDYFAAKALAALISEPPFEEGSESAVVSFGCGFEGDPLNRYAYVAYRFADAMLKARG